jgi:hypothetical protein
MDHRQIIMSDVLRGLTKDSKLRDVLIEIFLIHISKEERSCVGRVRQFFIKLMKHLVKYDFDIELPLQTIYYVNLIIVTLRIKPAMCHVTL